VLQTLPTFWYRLTSSERVTSRTLGAVTNRNVIRDRADGGHATRTRAWILTLIPDASFAHDTVRTDKTFGSTAFVRIALVLRYTFAGSYRVLRTTTSVRAAR